MKFNKNLEDDIPSALSYGRRLRLLNFYYPQHTPILKPD